jgi:phosphosulfolactate synthase
MSLELPVRTQRPRTYGITAVTDVGIPLRELEGILVDYHEYIDVAKLGVGSAYVTPNLADKLKLYREYGVHPYFGGSLFEKYLMQSMLDEYVALLRKYDVAWMEISAGILDTPLEKRVAFVEEFKDEFVILSEVGSKDVDKIMPPSIWIHEIKSLLDAGSTYVITEGRDSGTAGIFRPSGEIRTGLVTDIAMSVDPRRLIFEAPNAKSQMFFINLIGANVNLGNVSPRDLLLLEAQRQGLRNETFHNTKS